MTISRDASPDCEVTYFKQDSLQAGIGTGGLIAAGGISSYPQLIITKCCRRATALCAFVTRVLYGGPCARRVELVLQRRQTCLLEAENHTRAELMGLGMDRETFRPGNPFLSCKLVYCAHGR